MTGFGKTKYEIRSTQIIDIEKTLKLTKVIQYIGLISEKNVWITLLQTKLMVSNIFKK